MTNVKLRFTFVASWSELMIESFKQRIETAFRRRQLAGGDPEHVRKIRQILGLMNAAEKIADLDYAAFRLHPLTGNLKGFWSLTVRANWRIIFQFQDGKAFDVDLVDYH